MLRQAGVDPLVVASGFDEDALICGLRPEASPDEVVARSPEPKPSMSQRRCTPRSQAIALSWAVIRCCSWMAGYVASPIYRQRAATRHQWRDAPDNFIPAIALSPAGQQDYS
ncbi:putative maf-like protein [Mycobacterium kansasii]|uniref:Putative maf-like protein n=1 Tax=Mycobacterium kansasii TaxID=1768 RepID=A0A1V3WAC7_MYCKA|nr:putative maf-like protein [Mycobacterium kansasii]